MTILETFKTLDEDGNNCMTIQELSAFLTKTGVYIEKRGLDELFRFFDTKYDGRI
jgi:Ca2+-binding EF-hand superfamily protein